MPSAAVTRKIARQPGPAISPPPSDGPSAVPMAETVPSSPMALPVLSFGTVSPTSATVSAIKTAAPRPCAARAAMSIPSVGATAHTAEAAVNSRMPASSTLRCPIMSPSRPPLTVMTVMARR